ncbi:MAG TPA: hypothetical protein ENH82_08365 [bacterium]|nr:hypothetical protein [bacterium]
MHKKIIFIFLCLLIGSANLLAQDTVPESETEERPFVEGGAYDKPYLYKLASGRAAVGGYAETHFRYERENGVTEEITFLPKRFNLFMHAVISERFRMASELEFEEGTEEIKLELAILDFEIHPALTFRGGMILSPLGKFNLAHDSPANLLTDRPLASTQIIPTTLSEPGMGIFGAFYQTAKSRMTYELYAVNGFNSNIIEESKEGTRVAEGRGNIEDNNNIPSFTGRITYSPIPEGEVGFSWHTGQYNKSKMEGLVVSEKRNLTIVAFDGELRYGRFEFLGEYAHASIDLPENLLGTIFARKQQGFYLQSSFNFMKGFFKLLPESYFVGIARLGWVDFDSELEGDTHKRLTLGLNFRPTADSAFKLDYQYNWVRDRFNVQTPSAAILFSVATYF